MLDQRTLAPLLFFLGTYFLTCYLGAMILLWGPPSIGFLYKIFSGVDIQGFDRNQIGNLMILLHFPPIVLSFGYILGVALSRKVAKEHSTGDELISPKVVYWLLLASLLAGIFSIGRGNAFFNASNWFSTYDYWVSARWELFSTLTYPEFVNLYAGVPVLCCLAIVPLLNQERGRLFAAAIFIAGLTLSLLLFQKKQAIVYVLIVSLTLCLIKFKAGSPGVGRGIFTRLAILTIAGYSILLFLPMLDLLGHTGKNMVSRNGASITKMAEESSAPGLGNDPEKSPTVATLLNQSDFNAFFREFQLLPDHLKNTLFVVQSLLFRTSVPAIYYPQTFPDRHPFYGLDLPFDGNSPDDNLVVWTVMWPNTAGGSVTAPFQFPLYAQVGVGALLLLTGIIGVMLAIVWMWFLNFREQTVATALMGSLILILSIYLAIDSFRNAIFASYGVAWAALLLWSIRYISKYFEQGWKQKWSSQT